MPEGDGSQAGSQKEKSGKHHWQSLRGRMFTTDEKRDGSRKFKLNDDVMDFLQPSTNRPPPRPPTHHPTAQLSHIDTSNAKQWPRAEEANQQSKQSSRRRSASPKRNKHLHVKFTDAQPEIIGEGGDEAESPPREISRRRTQSLSPTQQRGGNPTDFQTRVRSSKELERKPQRDGGNTRGNPTIGFSNNGGAPPVPLKGELPEIRSSPMDLEGIWSVGEDDKFRPKLLARRSTGFSQIPGGSQAARALAGTPNDWSPPGGSDTEYNKPNTAHPLSFAARAQARMREEGRALHQGVRNSSPDRWSDTFPDNDEAPQNTNKYTPQPGPRARPALPSSVSSLPTPSPQSSSHPPVPTQLLPGYSIHSSPLGIEDDMQAVSFESSSKSTPAPVRSNTNSAADGALQEFSDRVQHLGSLFHLAAESIKPSIETSFGEWVKAATWWFLKGRGELEAAIRSRPAVTDGQTPHPSQSQKPHQAYINLAKAWWIVKYIAPQNPEVTRYGNSGVGSLIEVAKVNGNEHLAGMMETHQSIVASLRALAQSMKKNNILPPDQEEAPLASGIDTSIWIKYPTFTADVCGLLSGATTKSLLLQAPTRSPNLADTLPLSDTKRDFCYGRMFVDVLLLDEGNEAPDIRLPCALSLLRDRTDWQLKAAISSQNGLVNICVQPSGKPGPTWDDVRWRARQNAMLVKLPRGFTLNVCFKETDFKNFWGIYEYTQKVEGSLQPGPDEDLLAENTVKCFQYTDSDMNSKVFPKQPIKRCRVMLFEKKKIISEGTGTRKQHQGYRFLVVTSPKTKTLSCLDRELGKQNVIMFSFCPGDEGDPALLLRIKEAERDCTMTLTFHDEPERSFFYTSLTGANIQNDETIYADIPLKGLSIEKLSQAEGFSQSARDVLSKMEWQRLRVINKDPEDPDHEHAKTVLSEHLRICADSNSGCVTDRVNLGPSQLQLSLSVNSPLEARVLRPYQEDMTIAITENKLSKDAPQALKDLLKTIRNADTIRTYIFRTICTSSKRLSRGSPLNLTGRLPIYPRVSKIKPAHPQTNSVASSFAIARRRMVVPIYKKWEASSTRLQILKQDRVVQLAVFFQDFSHGDCMNFHLKGTDVFESFSKSGKHGIRIVDAKFALPKGEGEKNSGFVCLDMPEYPGEHDDITIAFDSASGEDFLISYSLFLPTLDPKKVANFLTNECAIVPTDRDRFQDSLPADVMRPSRLRK
ncbi:hypothetical protein FGG08_002113 [Glutinoglossum americanum]|uniref:Uncharacterized protein n=1 Tax=Glutinoglossum americanum TaxID=1670608 RepID=A0A9P8KZH0_9PEZI|nr:hypothetical protein FGG08_002113 [Glutinoglossum americanum]